MQFSNNAPDTEIQLNSQICVYLFFSHCLISVEPRLVWGYAFVSSFLKIIVTKGNWLWFFLFVF